METTQVKQPKEVVTVELMSKFVELMTEAKVNMFGSEIRGKMATLEATVEARLNLLPQKHEIIVNNAHSTEVDGITNEKFDEVMTYIANGEHVYLHGPAGSGKNVLAEQVANALGLKFYSASTLLQKYELLGYGDAKGDYVMTSFYEAFANGGLFFLDEFDGCSPEVSIALNGALANGYLEFPVHGFIRANENFHCIAAGNTVARGANELYNGRFQLDAATIDRFSFIEVDYYRPIELQCAGGNTELVDFIHEVRSICDRKGIQIVAGYRAIRKIAKFENKLPLDKVLESNLWKGLDKEDLMMIRESLSDSKYREAI